MRSSLVEVSDIAIEHALELLLAEDQQVVQAFLPDAPQIEFADGIGLWHVNRRLEKFDATGHRHSPETGTKLAVVIIDQILGYLPIGGGARSCCAIQASVGERVTPTWITLRECSSMTKKAKSDRKNKSVTCRKSHAQMFAA